MSKRNTREVLQLQSRHDGGMWRYYPGGQRRKAHHHDELEWNLVLAGSALYLVDERRYDLVPGSEIWLFPHQDHLLIDESPDYEMWIAVFRPAILARLCQGEAADALMGMQHPPGRLAKVLDAPTLARVAGLCQDIAEVRDDAAQFNAGLAFLALRAWAVHLRAEVMPPPLDVHPAVERAVRLMCQGGEALTIAEIAVEAALSESQLSRLFRRQIGVTLVHFRMLRRLERFLELYGNGHRRNLTEAGFEAGFGSYSHFHRAFRRVYGYSPREHHRRVSSTAAMGYPPLPVPGDDPQGGKHIPPVSPKPRSLVQHKAFSAR